MMGARSFASLLNRSFAYSFVRSSNELGFIKFSQRFYPVLYRSFYSVLYVTNCCWTSNASHFVCVPPHMQIKTEKMNELEQQKQQQEKNGE